MYQLPQHLTYILLDPNGNKIFYLLPEKIDLFKKILFKLFNLHEFS